MLVQQLSLFVYTVAFAAALMLGVTASAIRLRPVFAPAPMDETLKTALLSAASMLVVMFAGVTLMAWAQSLRGGTSAVNTALLMVSAATCILLVGRLLQAYRPQSPAAISRAVARMCGLTLALCWIRYPSWFTYEMTGTVAACFALAVVPTRRPRYLAIFLAAFVMYDVVSVFGTHAMVNAALGGAERPIIGGTFPPLVFIVPKNPLLFSGPVRENAMMLLGVGDVVLPGFIVCIAQKYGLAGWAACGYILGLLVCIVCMGLVGPMPATLFLIPAAATAFLLGAWRRGCAIEW